ncbi:MAG: YfhO family protein [Candidatus Hatepunaea meridiana]|nr:YfhO family protein [Candidatus Hatepunaea meridiana]
MADKKTKTNIAKISDTRKTTRETTISRLWERYKGDVFAVACLYLLIAIFFAPVVFQGKGLSPAADMVAAAGMSRIGAEALANGHFPLWNPTLFCGLPMFASLQYALFCYPPEYFIRVFSYIFGVGDYRIWLFHFLLAGIFMYLLARHYGCGKITAWLAGAAYAFSPQIIVLAEVGHGSKLMGMTYLPLIWLMLDRLRIKPSVGRAAALGAVFAVEILALHPQVAAYGALLMGLYLLYYGISSLIRSEFKPFSKLLLFFSSAMALSIALSAVLWVSVLDYARFSIRGAAGAGVAGGGVTWDYATGWSFHPLESITYLFPRFMGFGGQTYWGTVGTPQGQPFTHNPMYFGCGILLLAILAIVISRKSKWGFPVVLGSVALVLSFGKYLPILYGPMFHIFPMFNKFRAPVMGQVLLLLPVALLAGIGLEAVFRMVREGSKAKKLRKALFWIAIGSAIATFLIMVSEGLFISIYHSFAQALKPGTNPKLLQMAQHMARPDVIRVMALIMLMTGLTSIALKGKVKWQVLAGLFIIILLVDLWPVNRKLVTFTPRSYTSQIFKPDGVVRKLTKDNDKFRIHPLDNRYKAANWWSYFNLESTGGYFGAKMSGYQYLMSLTGLESWGALYNFPQLLDAMNVRYIITSYPLDMIFAELRKQGLGEPARAFKEFTPVLMPRDPRGGRGAFVYRNPGELPRARLIGEYRIIEDFDQTMKTIVSGDWDPAIMTLLDREPELIPQMGGKAITKITDYQSEKVIISVITDLPKLLVLADSYYPSGWKALVDGKEAVIMRADGVLRAIAIPAGEHTVKFIFKPKLFYLGLYISLFALAFVIGIGAYFIFRVKKV